MSAPNIYTIPPEADFMACLAAGIMADSQAKNIPLVDYRILLPTRRACAILQNAFRRAANGASLLLPQMQPLGDMSAEELTLAELRDTDSTFAPIQGAITPLARRLELSALLRCLDPSMPADAAYLRATALTDLLDQAQIERLDFGKLQGLAREDLAAHWQKILDFLSIITKAWPQHLATKNLIDPATQRDQRISRRAALWLAHPPTYPVIAAGSTGSMPATADLLAVIATLPQGAVILPGLDQASEATIWEAITDPTHPQFLLKALLDTIKCERRHVKLWPSDTSQSNHSARAALLRAALAPPIGTGQWRTTTIPPTAWTGLSQCVCTSLEHEAQVIALALRAALETPGRTAALVTRDRQLATRVTAHLSRWHIAIDDSAGQDLTTTPCGAFLLHILAAAQPEIGAVELLSLLQHPLTALGTDPASVRRDARLAERVLWRNRRVRGTLASHAHTAAMLAQTDPTKPGRPKITPEEAAELTALFHRLDRCLRPLTSALTRPNIALADILAAHLTAAEMLTTTTTEPGAKRLWQHDDGDAAATLLHELTIAMPDFALTQGEEYPALLRQIFAEQTVRPRFGTHPRLSILGPLEARFTTVDLTILGGMNEGSWPPAAVADPWLSRPMRKEFGLPAFERQIGQAAHDFVQLASRGDVLLTRASRVDSKPTTPSRFLWRLDMLRDASTVDMAARAAFMRPEQDWCALAQLLDSPKGNVVAISPPEPRPIAARRPTHFSVTEIGGWRRNPYGFYAKHVLRLRPLGELDPDFTRADQGNIVHDILHDFIRQHPRDLPAADTARAELLTLGRAAFAPVQDQPAIYASWWARFENSAQWFVAEEQRLRTTLHPVVLETEAALSIPINGVTYTLRGRPDRIDAGIDGLTITDYKTGSIPTGKQVEAGYEPQLPLLGMMAEQGAFTAIGARPVAALLHWQLQGRATIPDTRTLIKDPTTRIADARRMLEAMLRDFADPQMPYLVTPQPRFIPRYDDYRHLGRIDEWGAPGDAND